ncbi:hypothetical protein BDZ89DRAFT_176203 [Hymenopellis radicata]|nr:hypothetical protein BDZ89DRAFT_176203 [Hymenopellis radicata]
MMPAVCLVMDKRLEQRREKDGGSIPTVMSHNKRVSFRMRSPFFGRLFSSTTLCRCSTRITGPAIHSSVYEEDERDP